MRAFVIRESGQRDGIDFELVHEELIGPALAEAGITDSGTGELAEGGNVSEDMVRQLHQADIVVADVSVDNASVFYRLGIRHALRPGSTVLLSARPGPPPLDPGTVQYLGYDPDSPRGSLPRLAQVLRETLATDHAGNPPVVAGDDGHAAIEDQMLHAVWHGHRQWSQAATTAQRSVNRWRLSNLLLLVTGAAVAAFAAQTWLTSTAAGALAAVSAALLAAAGFVQASILTSENTLRWTGARAASEALKAETYRYLVRVKPYAGADRAEHLEAQFDTVQKRSKDLLVGQQVAAADDRPLPDVHTFTSYRIERAQEQADWHRKRIAGHVRTARRLRFCSYASPPPAPCSPLSPPRCPARTWPPGRRRRLRSPPPSPRT